MIFGGTAVFVLFPGELGFATQVCISALFVLSLALVLGEAGISSVGHATFFGTGAYAAGLCARHLSGDPLIGLAVAAAAGGTVALLSGLMILRAYGTALVVLTSAMAQLVSEIANKAQGVTGGADGLADFSERPLFGHVPFDVAGRVGFLYTLVVLVLSYGLIHRITQSPFGLTCRAIRSQHRRMAVLGCNVYLHLLIVFVVGGLFAGIAGGLQAEVTGVVALSTLGFAQSATAIVMLVLGGTRRLPGALLGTLVYMVVQRLASTFDPSTWFYAIGIMLIGTLTFLPQGLMQLVDLAAARLRRAGNR